MQIVMNPLDFGFEFTPDGWYAFDSKAAHAAALKARDAEAKELKAEGHAVKKFTLRNQRVRRGGLGTSHPEIDLTITVYGINY